MDLVGFDRKDVELTEGGSMEEVEGVEWKWSGC